MIVVLCLPVSSEAKSEVYEIFEFEEKLYVFLKYE